MPADAVGLESAPMSSIATTLRLALAWRVADELG